MVARWPLLRLSAFTTTLLLYYSIPRTLRSCPAVKIKHISYALGGLDGLATDLRLQCQAQRVTRLDICVRTTV